MTLIRTLPSYAWCADDPELLGVAVVPNQAPIPALLTETERLPFPVVPADAAGVAEALVEIADPRIRTIAAYWHTGWPASLPTSWLRESAADRLIAAADRLPTEFGLAVWDGWRDPALQQVLHEVAYRDPDLEPGFVNPPSTDPATPPPHATGGTVDLTLTWRGRPLALGTGFDDFVPQAHSRSLEAVDDQSPEALARDLRRLLRSVMVKAGFAQLECEWWHFEYGTRLWAAVNGAQPLYPAAARPGAAVTGS